MPKNVMLVRVYVRLYCWLQKSVRRKSSSVGLVRVKVRAWVRVRARFRVTIRDKFGVRVCVGVG